MVLDSAKKLQSSETAVNKLEYIPIDYTNMQIHTRPTTIRVSRANSSVIGPGYSESSRLPKFKQVEPLDDINYLRPSSQSGSIFQSQRRRSIIDYSSNSNNFGASCWSRNGLMKKDKFSTKDFDIQEDDLGENGKSDLSGVTKKLSSVEFNKEQESLTKTYHDDLAPANYDNKNKFNRLKRSNTSFAVRQNEWAATRQSVSSDGLQRSRPNVLLTMNGSSSYKAGLNRVLYDISPNNPLTATLSSKPFNFNTSGKSSKYISDVELDKLNSPHDKIQDRKLTRAHSVDRGSNGTIVPIYIPPHNYTTSRPAKILPDIKLPSSNGDFTSLPYRTTSSSPFSLSPSPSFSSSSSNSLGIRSTSVRRSFSKGSVLIDSIRRGRVRHVQLLLSAGMDADSRDDDGECIK